jgi:hypothetical protein
MIALDERVAAGMRLQLAARAERLRAGDRPLGWKVGFGSAAAMARLGIDRALVGFLLRGNLLPDGAEVPLDGWAAPALEPEIAVHLARTCRRERRGTTYGRPSPVCRRRSNSPTSTRRRPTCGRSWPVTSSTGTCCSARYATA